MRTIIIIALLSCCALAQTNSVVVNEVDNATQNGRVVTFGRAFAKAEIAVGSCPRPVVAGVAVADGSWQSDSKNVWDDGSIKFGLISYVSSNFTALQAKTTTFQNGTCNNSGLSKTQMLNFNSGVWGASIEITANGTTRVIDSATMLNALAFTEGQLEYWSQGPVQTCTKVHDATTATAYDAGWSWNGTTMTSPVTGNSTTASLHPIFMLCFYPSTNTVKVDYIVENMWSTRLQDQRYSVVLKAGNPLVQVYTKSLFTHIMKTRWRKTFWSGTAPGHIRNDYNFAYLIKTKLLPCYEHSTSGTDPCNTVNTAVTVDPAQSIANSPGYPDWITSDFGDIAGAGLDALWSKSYSGNNEGAPLQREDLLALYNFGTASISNGKYAKAWQILTGRTAEGDTATSAGLDTITTTTTDVSGGAGMWNNQGNVPYHMRESRVDGYKFRCSAMADKDATVTAGTPTTCSSGGSTEIAFGRSLSRHAHTSDQYAFTGTSVGTGTANGWDVSDVSHWLDYSYLAYLITGDWYYYDEMLQAASFALASVSPTQASGSSNYFFALIAPIQGGIRQWGWGLQSVGRAAALSVDGSVEATYFTDMLASNLEVMEGVLGVTGTSRTPASTNSTCSAYNFSNAVNRWDWGRCTVFSQCDNSICTAVASNAITNTQHSLVPGECNSVLGYHQGTISSCTASASPTSCTTSAAHGMGGGVYVMTWGGTGNWLPWNSARPNGDAANVGTWVETTTGASTFTVALNSTGFGAFTGSGKFTDGLLDNTLSTDFQQDWMNWGTLTVLGHLNDIGLSQVSSVYGELQKRLVEELRDPASVKYTAASYISPYKNGGSSSCVGLTTRNAGFSSWTDTTAAFPPPVQAVNNFRTNSPVTGNFPCADHGYALMARAAASYVTGVSFSCPTSGTCSGQAAWNDLAVTGGGSVPYFNNAEFAADTAGCSAGNLGAQIKFALVDRVAATPSITTGTVATPGMQLTTGTVIK